MPLLLHSVAGCGRRVLRLAQAELATGDAVAAESLLAMLHPRAAGELPDEAAIAGSTAVAASSDSDDGEPLMPTAPRGTVPPPPGAESSLPVDAAAAVQQACYGLPATFDTRLARPLLPETAAALEQIGLGLKVASLVRALCCLPPAQEFACRPGPGVASDPGGSEAHAAPREDQP